LIWLEQIFLRNSDEFSKTAIYGVQEILHIGIATEIQVVCFRFVCKVALLDIDLPCVRGFTIVISGRRGRRWRRARRSRSDSGGSGGDRSQARQVLNSGS
jgi:hypothetical protein